MGTTNFNDLAVDSLTSAGAITAAGFTNTGLGTSSAAAGITAHAGGGQASATALTKEVNSVDTVATAADSVALPLAVIGQKIYLTNNTATSMQVFGSGTDTINIGAGDVATATGVAQAANKSAIYFCTKTAPAGKWQRVLTA
jgi:hypothetical protein